MDELPDEEYSVGAVLMAAFVLLTIGFIFGLLTGLAL
jgi:hypothetical protein